MNISLRPVRPEDDPFLLQVYAGTREQEMSLAPWDESQKAAFLQMQFAAQRRHYQERFPDAQEQIILLGDQPAGRVWVHRSPQRIHILDLALQPTHREAGIETAVLRDLLREGGQSRRPVDIYLTETDPVWSSCTRLGFVRVEQQGFHHRLEWRPDREPGVTTAPED